MGKQEHRIVVGVDGSESSKAALRWAIRQAKLTGASVGAVTAWRYPTGHGLAPASGPELDFEGNARKSLAEVLGEVLGEVSGLEPEVPVHPHVAEGHAAEALLRAAREAVLPGQPQHVVTTFLAAVSAPRTRAGSRPARPTGA
jgi:nucleotide-binding universal stress UspA family protein